MPGEPVKPLRKGGLTREERKRLKKERKQSGQSVSQADDSTQVAAGETASVAQALRESEHTQPPTQPDITTAAAAAMPAEPEILATPSAAVREADTESPSAPKTAENTVTGYTEIGPTAEPAITKESVTPASVTTAPATAAGVDQLTEQPAEVLPAAPAVKAIESAALQPDAVPAGEKTVKIPEYFDGYTESKLTHAIAPKEGGVIMVLDANAVMRLAQPLGKDGKGNFTGLDLVTKMLEKGHIAKVVIPDYVADFEVRGVARSYNKIDQPLTSRQIRSYKEQQVAALDRFLKGAIRRHSSNRPGNGVFLAGNGEKPNENVVIWETATGRALSEDIYKMIHGHGETEPSAVQSAERKGIEAVKQKYWARLNGDKEKSNGNDRGEACIDEFTDKELYPTWNNPCLVVSSDLKYIMAPKRELDTVHGSAKLYMNTLALLESMMERFSAEHAGELQLSQKSASEQAKELAKRIAREKSKGSRPSEPETKVVLRGDDSLISRYESLANLIPQASREALIKYPSAASGRSATTAPSPAFSRPAATMQKPPPLQRINDDGNPLDTNNRRWAKTAIQDRQVPPQAPASAPDAVLPIIPDPVTAAINTDATITEATITEARKGETPSLKKMIMHLMADRDMTFGDVAAAINGLTPHMPEITPLQVAKLCTGTIAMDDEHLYALLELLVARNPAIAENDKATEARRFITAVQQNERAIKAGDSQGMDSFGTFLLERLVSSNHSDFKILAESLNAAIGTLRIRPEEGPVTAHSIIDMIADDKLPSPALALALRKVLHENSKNAGRFDEAYIAARYTRPQQPDALSV